jgi:hypothetical protein
MITAIAKRKPVTLSWERLQSTHHRWASGARSHRIRQERPKLSLWTAGGVYASSEHRQ